MIPDADAPWMDEPTRSAAESPCWLCGTRCVLRAHVARAWIVHDTLRDRGMVPTRSHAHTGPESSGLASLLRRVGFHPRTHAALIAPGPAMAQREGCRAHPSYDGTRVAWAVPWAAALWALEYADQPLWGRVLRARPRLRARFGLLYQLAGDVEPARQYLQAMEPAPDRTGVRVLRARGMVPVIAGGRDYGQVWTNLNALTSGTDAVHALCALGTHPDTGAPWVWAQAWFAAVGVQTGDVLPDPSELDPALARRHALVRVPGLRPRVETVTRLEGAEAGMAVLDALLPGDPPRARNSAP